MIDIRPVGGFGGGMAGTGTAPRAVGQVFGGSMDCFGGMNQNQGSNS